MLIAYVASAGVTLILDRATWTLEGTRLDDVILGAVGVDWVHGDHGDDVIDLRYPGIAHMVGKSVFAVDVAGGAKRVAGGGGSDTIHGRIGADRLSGDDGDDFVFGYGGNDAFLGGPGRDRIYGGDGRDEALAGGQDDLIHGGAGNDVIDASTGADWVAGGAGFDRLAAGGDADTVLGGAGFDRIEAGDGDDWVDPGSGDDVVWLGSGNDVAVALDDLGRGDDRIRGEAGNDRIHGGRGDDALDGGAEADRLIGGAGADALTGGAGADTFVIRGNYGVDVVADFALAEGDRVLIEQGINGLGSLGADALRPRVADVEAGAYLDLGPGDGVLFAGLDAAALQAALDVGFAFV